MSDYSIVYGIKIAAEFTPEKFGRLTTLGPKFRLPVGNQGQGAAYQVCACDCGDVRVVAASRLRQGGAKSCGCYSRDVLLARITTHGKRKSAEYSVWTDMKTRCTNAKDKQYKDYGGRGIRVCARWQKFENFYADMGPRPSNHDSIERSNTNSDYSPENCFWADRRTQANNKRSNRIITINGKSDTLANWCRHYSANYKSVHTRLRAGMDPLTALTKKAK